MQPLQLTLVMDLRVPVALLVGVTCRIGDWQDSVLAQNTPENQIFRGLRLFLGRLVLLLVLVLVLLLGAVLILVLILSLVASLVLSPLSVRVLFLLDLGVWHKLMKTR